MPVPDFYIKQNDDASSIASVLTDVDGAEVDINNAAIRFHMRPISGATATVINQVANNDQSGTTVNVGHVSYDWQAGDTSIAGLYLAEWQVTFSGSSAVQTFPNGGYTLIRISEELG